MRPHPPDESVRNAHNVSSSVSATLNESLPPVLSRRHGGARDSIAAVDDVQLLTLLAKDATAGMAQIYDRYSRLVYGIARAVLGNAHEAEDLTQEIFVALLDRCGYDPLRGSFAAYLTTLTRSRAIDVLRAKGRNARKLGQGIVLEQSSLLPQSAAAPHQVASDDESATSVRAALLALPATQRRVLELAYFKDLSQTEIATQLAAPLGSVKTWARQGLLGLRAALQPTTDLTDTGVKQT